jgi:hypothetical protein
MGFSAKIERAKNYFLYKQVVKRPWLHEAVIETGKEIQRIFPQWHPGFSCAKATYIFSRDQEEIYDAITILSGSKKKGEEVLLSNPMFLSNYHTTVGSMDKFKHDINILERRGFLAPEKIIAAWLKRDTNTDKLHKIISRMQKPKLYQESLMASLHTRMSNDQIRDIYDFIVKNIYQADQRFFDALHTSFVKMKDEHGNKTFRHHWILLKAYGVAAWSKFKLPPASDLKLASRGSFLGRSGQ